MMKPCRKSPLRDQVSARLRQLVKGLASGERIPSESSLARNLRVSVHVLREGLSVLAGEGLLERKHGSGTYVADRRTWQHVAILLGIDPEFLRDTYYASRVTAELLRFLRENGCRARTYRVPYEPSERDADSAYAEFSDNLAAGRILGAIAVQGPFDDRWRHLYQRVDAPVVGANSPYAVRLNEIDMIESGVRRLIEAGRRRLALLMLPMTFPLGPAGPTKLEEWRAAQRAFAAAVTRGGGRTRPEWVCADQHPLRRGAGVAAFRQVWTSCDEKPDGLLVCDDVLFAEATLGILGLGARVPDELMIVTHANKGSDVLYPFPTVCMEYDLNWIAEETVKMLLGLVNRTPPERAVRYAPFQWVEHKPPVEAPSPSARQVPGRVVEEGSCPGPVIPWGGRE
jgi:DNA-binding LacI/PurR family transcriptional regulator